MNVKILFDTKRKLRIVSVPEMSEDGEGTLRPVALQGLFWERNPELGKPIGWPTTTYWLMAGGNSNGSVQAVQDSGNTLKLPAHAGICTALPPPLFLPRYQVQDHSQQEGVPLSVCLGCQAAVEEHKELMLWETGSEVADVEQQMTFLPGAQVQVHLCSSQFCLMALCLQSYLLSSMAEKLHNHDSNLLFPLDVPQTQRLQSFRSTGASFSHESLSSLK